MFVHGAHRRRGLDIRDSERAGNGYRHYYNGGKLSMNLPPVWFDPPQGLADSATAVPDVTVICTTGVLAGPLDQLRSLKPP
jgi:hypothetical protein